VNLHRKPLDRRASGTRPKGKFCSSRSVAFAKAKVALVVVADYASGSFSLRRVGCAAPAVASASDLSAEREYYGFTAIDGNAGREPIKFTRKLTPMAGRREL
jgi:hypothetical protein